MNLIKKAVNKIRDEGICSAVIVIWKYYACPMMDYIGLSITKLITWKKVNEIIILESHNDFDSNAGAFYDYLLKNEYNKKYKIVWMLRNEVPNNLPYNVGGIKYLNLGLKKWYYLCTAKYLLCCHQMIPSVKASQKSVYMSHGPFCLKCFKGKIMIPDKMSYILIPSENLEELLADQYMIEYPSERIKFLGYPMHDILYTQVKGELKKITEQKFGKVVLWMPTFRQSVDKHRIDTSTELPLGIPIFKSYEEFIEFNESLRQMNTLLVIKIHPMQDLKKIKIKNCTNIIVLDGVSVKELGVDNYRLMIDTDALISDYSSAAYDYLHLNRPIAYTMDDEKNYSLGLIVDDPNKLMAGPILRNYIDLKNFINSVYEEKDGYREQRLQLLHRVFKFCDGNSSKRLAEFLEL